MRASRGTLAFGLLLSVALPSGAALASDPGVQLLLERASYWRSQHRLDLAGELLNKALALDPAQPDALFERGKLALEEGKSDEAQQYFGRLRQLTSANPRAAELVNALAQPGNPQNLASLPPAATPMALAAVTMTTPDVDTTPPARPAAVVASADSNDFGARPAPQTPAATATLGAVARVHQIAALPQGTIADGDTATAASSSLTYQAGTGDTTKPVQVAQLELIPPPPVDDYQHPYVTTPYSPADTLEMDIDRALTQLEGQANPSLIAGVTFRAHSGDDGLNRLNEVGIPIEASFSPWYTGTARLTILPVYLDANGSVSSGELGEFGINPLLAAKGLALLPSGDEHAEGVGIRGGYSYRDFSAQFGTSPLGFPVTHFVGDAALAPKFFDNTLTVKVEGLREPVTDSVLSYAGIHAPVAAANGVAPGAFGGDGTWGGVVKTGAQGTIFYDDQTYGAYGGAGYGWLTGKNVANNTQLNALTGAYFRPWKTDDWAIRVGVSAYFAAYNKNLSGFTFGQGGYFSPQDYEALTFPVEYMGHTGPWTYLASAALGVQHFNTDSSPIFPTSSLAQSTLVGLGGNGFFSGTHSTGPAFSFRGQLEYAISDTLAIGIAASIDNGNDYTEGIGKLYMRKTFDWFAPASSASNPSSIVQRDQPMSRL